MVKAKCDFEMPKLKWNLWQRPWNGDCEKATMECELRNRNNETATMKWWKLNVYCHMVNSKLRLLNVDCKTAAFNCWYLNVDWKILTMKWQVLNCNAKWPVWNGDCKTVTVNIVFGFQKSLVRNRNNWPDNRLGKDLSVNTKYET